MPTRNGLGNQTAVLCVQTLYGSLRQRRLHLQCIRISPILPPQVGPVHSLQQRRVDIKSQLLDRSGL